MKALVMWADEESRNLGVRALARGAEALIKRSWPESNVEFQSFGNGAAPFTMRERTLLKELVPGRRDIARWVSEYQFVLDMRWGDSFSDIYGLRRLVMMNSLARIAASSGSTVIMGPQTIGPFKSLPGRLLARSAAANARVIMCRDTRSAEYCDDLGLPFAARSTDVVFALPVPTVSKTRDIAINVSGLLSAGNPHVDSHLYRRSMAELCRSLIRDRREVTLFAHVLDSDNRDNDVPALKQLQDELDYKVDAFVPTGLDDVREFVAGARIVVGARMHACLNALSTGTPAIPLAYSRKFSPLLKDLAWHHTIDLRGRDSYVTEVIEKVEDFEALQADIGQLRSRADELLDSGVQVVRKAVDLS